MTNPGSIGKYVIKSRLGEGGMGVVYLGYDPVIERTVAIKTIKKSLLDPAEAQFILDRFKREAQAAGRLLHPNIVAIYEYGEDADYAFIAMECVRGDSLQEFMARNVRAGPKQFWSIISQLLNALDYSHGQGVVHRDIKPSNILINLEGRVKVSDFGIARIDTSNLTKVGDVMGTPNYMSPEQFRGEAADARSDIYSTAVIIYELLTGKKPFAGTSVSIVLKVLEETPPNPSEINSELNPEVDSVIQKALAKSREDRFASALEFAEALDAALEDKPKLDLDLSGEMLAISRQRPAPNLLDAARKISAAQAKKSDAPPEASSAPEALDIELETAETPAAAVPKPTFLESAQADSAVKPRILFVDDEERVLNALKSIFRLRYHVFTAPSGDLALAFVKKFHIHLVVSDQRMPEMLGVELLRQVKELSPNSVRILLTGYSDLASIVGSINDGEVYRFINKPWDNQDIQDTVSQAIAIGLELADAKAPQAAAPARTDAALLVVDDDQEVYRASRELLADTCNVSHAKNVQEALNILEGQEVAVIIADIETGEEDNTALFKLLKQEHPQILTIVLTSASDSELVIELINQAQIYRFLNKPINLKLMKSHVQSALARFQAYQTAPKLLHAHQVESSAKARDSSLGQMILSRIKSLRGRFALR